MRSISRMHLPCLRGNVICFRRISRQTVFFIISQIPWRGAGFGKIFAEIFHFCFARGTIKKNTRIGYEKESYL